MSITILQKYLPENTLPFLRKWFDNHHIHIRITKGRQSKLGDYRKMPDSSHEITVNSTLPPQLFFFVLTHELAHLVAFERFGRRISPHGAEWKNTFGEMLLESIAVYEEDFRHILLKFSKSPKANFMSSPDLVRYFHIEDDDSVLLENFQENEFIYRKQRYKILEKAKKRYLCENIESGKKYYFKPLAKVQKI
ncbi:MAG: transcription elongation protein SprT [Bergeyella sp.]